MVAEIWPPTARISGVGLSVGKFVWAIPSMSVYTEQRFFKPADHLLLLLLLIEAFYFLRVQVHTHMHTLANGLRREKEMDTYIQLDQQINYSERCDSRCLEGCDSAEVSAATFDQKFKNRPCVADRRLDGNLCSGSPSHPPPSSHPRYF